MGTRMLLFPGEEHLHRAPSWGGIHDPDAGNPSSWMAPACYSPTSTSGGNTWSKRLAASSNTHNNNNNDSDSWEVRAFAEDASTSGQWPPRSYSCSFCQREFRTAQALGGHMNVHRRERAQANQLAQLRTTTGTDAHNNGTTTTPTSSHDDNNNNNRIPNHNANHWLTRSNSQDIDACNSRAYAPTRSVVGDDDCYPASYGGPSSYRNSSSYESRYESAWRSPYDAPRDCGLDLELRLGQRYD